MRGLTANQIQSIIVSVILVGVTLGVSKYLSEINWMWEKIAAVLLMGAAIITITYLLINNVDFEDDGG